MIAIFPETLSFAEKGMIEHLAVSARRYFERLRSPILDLDALLKNMGIAVEVTGIDGFGALLAQDRQGRFTITMVLEKSPDRFSQKFIKAHLLGHYLLHLQPMIARGELGSYGFKELVCPMQRYCVGGRDSGLGMESDLEGVREEQCDRFAGALLIPKGMLQKAWATLQDIEKIADFFGVAKNCLQRRMVDVGLVFNGPQSFLEAEKALRKEVVNEGIQRQPHPSEVKPSEFQLTAPKRPALIPPSYISSQGESSVPKKSEARSLKSSPSGMHRIREIAKMLDKSRS